MIKSSRVDHWPIMHIDGVPLSSHPKITEFRLKSLGEPLARRNMFIVSLKYVVFVDNNRIILRGCYGYQKQLCECCGDRGV